MWKNQTNSRYFEQNLSRTRVYITGMAIPHIYFKDYGKAKVFCPSIENQIRIASLLHNIEQKLVVEQNLIISLSAQKSYLLRMLFI